MASKPKKKSEKPAEVSAKVKADAGPEKKRSHTALWIILGLIVFVALNGVLTFFLIQRFAPKSAPAPQSAVSAQPARPTLNSESKQKAIFYAFDPAFVVNIKGARRNSFLQVKIQVMTQYPEVADALKRYEPIIRNDLLLLFSNQTYKTLRTINAKKTLQTLTKRRINKILRDRTGAGGVEGVYFTSFVMQ